MASCGRLLVVLFIAVQICSLVAASSLERRTRRHTSEQKARLESHQGSSTACSDAGYNGQCCNLGFTTCYVSPFNCYCDLSCHLYQDCCPDIEDIGCLPPGQVECPSPPPIGNGTIDFNPVPNPKRPGTIAHYRCNDEYALVGNSLRVCQPNGNWTGEPPECRGVCPELSPPPNGRVTYEVVTSSNLRPVRTVAVYSCDPGYSLRYDNNIRRVCRSNSTWSGSDVKCQPTTCQTGFPGGCCTSGNCFVRRSICIDGRDCTCSCSLHCYVDGNCCPDVGCNYRNCSHANLSQGCCDWASHPRQGCRVQGNGDGCYCDSECKARDDCCPDVPDDFDPASCTTESASRQYFTGQSVRTMVAQQGIRPRPPMGRQQSVRMRPPTRAQLARYRESQAKKQSEDQVARELASEMRAMSAKMGSANPDKKAQWEAIIEELKRIEEN